MLLSGDSFLILDPQQCLLPRNRRHKRKVGIKILISTARRICPDQLAPFNRVGGCLKGVDHFDGTLFRFPLRESKSTKLRENLALVNSAICEGLLNRYFEDTWRSYSSAMLLPLSLGFGGRTSFDGVFRRLV